MPLTDNLTYTWPGVTNLEYFPQPTERVPDIRSLFRVRAGIDSAEQLHRLLPLEKVTKVNALDGTFTRITSGSTVVERTLDVKDYRMELSFNPEDFVGTVYETALKQGVAQQEIDGTVFEEMLNFIIESAMQRDIFRRASFATTGGAEDFDGFNGIWPLMQGSAAGVGASYDIDAINTGITSIDAAGEAKGILEALYDGADITLDDVEEDNKAFFVTRSLYTAYVKELETNSNEGGWRQLQSGVRMPQFRGVDVVKVSAWDKYVTDGDNTVTDDVLALYTAPENHVIGLDDAASYDEHTIWHSKDDDKIYVRAKYKQGYIYLQPKMQAVSYGTNA